MLPKHEPARGDVFDVRGTGPERPSLVRGVGSIAPRVTQAWVQSRQPPIPLHPLEVARSHSFRAEMLLGAGSNHARGPLPHQHPGWYLLFSEQDGGILTNPNPKPTSVLNRVLAAKPCTPVLWFG